MKLGTIGTGIIVKIFLDGALKNDFELQAVYSRNQETGEALLKEFNGKKVYSSLEEMLKDEEVEIVYVASPNSLHFEQTLKALQHNKHVITEKPFTSTSKELQILMKEAKKRHLFLFEAITNIHLPNYKLIKEHIGKIGRIKIIQCNYSQYSRRYDALLKGETPNVFNPEFSGGALMDINIYNIHFVLGLFGEPKEVVYFANKHANGIDTSGILILKYDDFLCELVGAKDTKSVNFAMIQGEKGYIYLDGASGCKEVKVVTNDTEEVYNLQESLNPLYYECVDFMEIIKNGAFKECYDLLEHSKQVMEVVEKARKSATIVFKVDEAIE